MIYRLGGSQGLADIDLVVDPIRVSETQLAPAQSADSPAAAPAAPKKDIDWAWIILAGLAGLALGYWLAGEAGRGGGPT